MSRKRETLSIYEEVKWRHLRDYIEQFYKHKLSLPKSMNIKAALLEYWENREEYQLELPL